MICRIWHGWTTPAKADAYERLLRAEIFHGIAERSAHYEVRQPKEASV